MSPEQTAQVFLQKGRTGYFHFSEQVIKEEEIKDLPEIRTERGEKTPSQRLRSVLYVLWQQSKSTLSADQFYREKMEEHINSIKAKLL